MNFNGVYRIGSLLLAFVVCAFYFYCVHQATRFDVFWCEIVMHIGFYFIALFSLLALTFLIVWPVGLLEKLLATKLEAPDSPFATDRLPEQKITPRDENVN